MTWHETQMQKPPNPGRILKRYTTKFDAKRMAREAEKEGRSLEIYAVHPHIDDRVRDGHSETRFDVFEVAHGGVRWIVPGNFYDWPWGGRLEHLGSPWASL